MSTKFWTVASTAVTGCAVAIMAMNAPTRPAFAAESPEASESLLPRAVIDQAEREGETPAYPLPTLPVAQVEAGNDGSIENVIQAQPRARSLAALVSQNAATQTSSREMECLAGATYFESKGEPLDGQLAVAHTVLNRSRSGRFPGSVCGVVFQPGQFSFVRGGGFPPIARSSGQWKTAVAVARIAMNDLWDSPTPNSLFFHARYVSPGWKLKRVGAVGNHVFYR